MWLQRLRTLVSIALGACLLIGSVAGCQKGRATVSGKVTFNGKPLTAGTVAFVASPSVMGTGTIKPDGTYTISDAPVGNVTVTVNTPPVPLGHVNMEKPPKGMGAMPADMIPEGEAKSGGSVTIVPAPQKYNSADTSPLKFTVARGSQTYDIALVP